MHAKSKDKSNTITSLRTVLAEVDQPEKANAIMKKLSQAATLG